METFLYNLLLLVLFYFFIVYITWFRWLHFYCFLFLDTLPIMIRKILVTKCEINSKFKNIYTEKRHWCMETFLSDCIKTGILLNRFMFSAFLTRSISTLGFDIFNISFCRCITHKTMVGYRCSLIILKIGLPWTVDLWKWDKSFTLNETFRSVCVKFGKYYKNFIKTRFKPKWLQSPLWRDPVTSLTDILTNVFESKGN